MAKKNNHLKLVNNKENPLSQLSDAERLQKAKARLDKYLVKDDSPLKAHLDEIMSPENEMKYLGHLADHHKEDK